MNKILIVIMLMLLLNISLIYGDNSGDECMPSTESTDCSESYYGFKCIVDAQGNYCGCTDTEGCVGHFAGKKCLIDDYDLSYCGCEDDTDCSAGYICGVYTDEDSISYNICKESDAGDDAIIGCENDTDCENEQFAKKCNPTTKECVECLSDSGCVNNPYGTICDTLVGWCACNSNTDCISGYECDAIEGYCIESQPVSGVQQTGLPYEYIDNEIKQILSIPDDGSASIVMNKKMIGIPTTFKQINSDYLPKGITEQDVLIINPDVDVRTAMKYFTYITAGGSQNLTLVKKTIKTKLKDYVIIEEIPKSLAQTIENNILFPSTIQITKIKDDPVFSVKGSKNSGFYYIVEGNAIDYLTSMQTIIAPTNTQTRGTGTYEEPVCGDGVCTDFLEDKYTCPEDCKGKIKWAWLIFLVIALIAGIAFINTRLKKKKKEKGLKFESGKVGFKSLKDEQNLKTYVGAALKSGKTKQEIKQILLQKGWTEQQINSVL